MRYSALAMIVLLCSTAQAMSIRADQLAGTWKKTDTGTVFDLKTDETLAAPGAIDQRYKTGRWSVQASFLVLTFANGEEKILRVVDKDHVRGEWTLTRVDDTSGASCDTQTSPPRGTDRFVGEWLKWDTGTRLILNADMTYVCIGSRGNKRTGKWTATATTVGIHANGRPLTLELQPDGILRGRDSRNWVWKLRKISGPPASSSQEAQPALDSPQPGPLPQVDDVTRRRCERIVKDLKDGIIPGMMRPRFDAIRRSLRKSLDQEVTLETRSGKKSGQLAEVNDADVVLQVQIKQHGRVLGSSRMTVKFLDLTAEQLDELDTGWRKDKDVLALMALASGGDPTPHMTASAVSDWIRTRQQEESARGMRRVAKSKVTLIISSVPDDAEVLLDKESVGHTPFRQWVSPGNYGLTLKKDGYKELSRRVEVGRKMVILRLELKPKTYPVDILFKNMNEQTMDWHVFANDGTHLGIAPGTFGLPKGRVRLLLVKEGFRDIPLSVDVTGDPLTVDAADPRPGRSSWARLCVLQFVGVWQKVDTGSKLLLHADMSYQLNAHDGTGWDGKWEMTPTTVEIQSFGGPLLLTLQKDGMLTGRARNGFMWRMRKIGAAADAARPR